MQRRHGFTLVELLVAMALTLFIMVIITSAFVTGLDTFRGLKGIGDMQEGLRTAAQRLRDDLRANHFEGDRKMSDPSMLHSTLLEPGTVRKPEQGFFRVSEKFPLVSPIFEGQDVDGGPVSYRATDNYLHFTVNLRGSREEKFYLGTLPPKVGGINHLTDYATTLRFPSDPSLEDARYQDPKLRVYSSQWAEVAYFLVPSKDELNQPRKAGNTPLYNLYRLQRLVIPSDDKVEQQNSTLISGALWEQYGEISCQRFPSVDVDGDGIGELNFQTPTELNNLPVDRSFYKNDEYGASLLLNNVVSFLIQIPEKINTGTGEIIFDRIKENPYPELEGEPELGVNEGLRPRAIDSAYFDGTTTGQNLPSIFGLRITIRVWDEKTKQTRQITIYQDI